MHPQGELAPVMFFDGEEHLAEAGALLLQCPEVHAAVVHNVGKVALFALSNKPNSRGETVREALFTDAPSITELDAYVRAHHNNSLLAKRYALTSLADTQRILTRSGSIGLHYDTPFQSDLHTPIGSFEGPLTMSIRIDTTSATRTFQVHRTRAPILTAEADEATSEHSLHLLQHTMHKTRANPDLLHDIDQRPGDAIIMLNYPTPTIHAVQNTPGELTRSMVASYLLHEASV